MVTRKLCIATLAVILGLTAIAGAQATTHSILPSAFSIGIAIPKALPVTGIAASCTPDAQGYCVASQVNNIHSGPCTTQDGLQTREIRGTITYGIQTPNGSVQTFTERLVDDGTGTCNSTALWSPAEPSVFFNDPNLP